MATDDPPPDAGIRSLGLELPARHALHGGGWISYDDQFLLGREADLFFDGLMTLLPWREERLYGSAAPRRVAWFADEGVRYSYSRITHLGRGWHPALVPIRDRVAEACGEPFNSVLANLYRDGRDSMGMHADDEPELGTNPLIASVSLGAARRFVLKHRATGERKTLVLAHGSLLVMGGSLQHHWLHGIPKTAASIGPRINLTFRRTGFRPPGGAFLGGNACEG